VKNKFLKYTISFVLNNTNINDKDIKKDIFKKAYMSFIDDNRYSINDVYVFLQKELKNIKKADRVTGIPEAFNKAPKTYKNPYNKTRMTHNVDEDDKNLLTPGDAAKDSIGGSRARDGYGASFPHDALPKEEQDDDVMYRKEVPTSEHTLLDDNYSLHGRSRDGQNDDINARNPVFTEAPQRMDSPLAAPVAPLSRLNDKEDKNTTEQQLEKNRTFNDSKKKSPTDIYSVALNKLGL